MRRQRAARAIVSAATLAVLGLACSSRSRPAEEPTEVPDRGATAGDEILAMVPAGADSILELDLARLRENAVVGKLFRALTDSASDAEVATEGVNLFGAGDLVVFVSYGIGDPEPERLVIVRGQRAESVRGGYRLDDVTVAIASGEMQKRLALVAAGAPSLATASPLLRLRALAMPEGAKGASVRVAAHLDFDARIALAKALDVDEVPVSVSVWGDVADDLAIVALISGETKSEGKRLRAALGNIRTRLAELATVRLLGLGRLIRAATIDERGAAARLVLVIGPRRLGRLVERLLTRLGAGREAA